jgi:hypothetical protein
MPRVREPPCNLDIPCTVSDVYIEAWRLSPKALLVDFRSFIQSSFVLGFVRIFPRFQTTLELHRRLA